MKTIIACLLGLTLLPMACALEGKIDAAVSAKMGENVINLNYSENAVSAIVKDLNGSGLMKVGVDHALANKRLKDLKFEGATLTGACDKLATVLKVKAYVLNDFIYIGDKLPAGAKTYDGTPASFNGVAALAALNADFPGITPGQFRILPWLPRTPQEVRDEGKPVLLYIIDKDAKADTGPAIFFESVVLRDPEARKAVEVFSYVLIDLTSEAWGPSMTASAKGGCAVMLLTHDGQPRGQWASFTPSAAALAKAPIKPAATKKTDPAEPVKTGAAHVPGLGGEKTDKTPEVKTKEPQKTGALENE